MVAPGTLDTPGDSTAAARPRKRLRLKSPPEEHEAALLQIVAAEVASYTVGDRVTFTPAFGLPLLGTVRFVGEELLGNSDGGASRVVGLEADEPRPGLHDGRHPHSGQYHFRCQSGRGLYVPCISGRLRPAAGHDHGQDGQEVSAADAQGRLVGGLEALSEDGALRLAHRHRLAEGVLRHGHDALWVAESYRKCWSAKTQRYLYVHRGCLQANGRATLPRGASVTSIEGGPESCGSASQDSSLHGLHAGDSALLPSINEARVSRDEAEAVFHRCTRGDRWHEPLPAALLLSLVQVAREMLLQDKVLLELKAPAPGKLVVVGDTHGHLKDLVHIWRQEGFPSPQTAYLFNGDICDRGDSQARGGQQALHIWACVLSFKIACPQSVFVTRGNHEDSVYWTFYGESGFSGEIERKYCRKEADQLIEAFGDLCACLPLAAVVGGECLVVHGGLPRLWQGRGALRLAELRQVRRPLPLPDSTTNRSDFLVSDTLWADPRAEPGVGANERGGDLICFGPDVTASFLREERLRLLIRSHEVPGRQPAFKGRGFEWWHPVGDPAANSGLQSLGPAQKGWCLTVFSASDYCGQARNPASRVVFDSALQGSGGFVIKEHDSSEAEQSLLAARNSAKAEEAPAAGSGGSVASSSACTAERRALATGLLLRGLVEAIVEHKHQFLAEFTAVDGRHDWFLGVEEWATCCHRVLPRIPWEDLAADPRLVPVREGRVCYTLFLTRYQIRFRNKLGLHAGFRRRLTSQLFEGLLRADRALRETLGEVDLDGDGTVSVDEFASALARFGKVLTPVQAKALYRTTVARRGRVHVEDFLAGLALDFSLAQPRPTTPSSAFVPAQLDAICRDILDHAAHGGGEQSSVAVSLRRFFEAADSNHNGFLEAGEFVAALRPLPSCAALSEEQLEAVARHVDFDGNGSINYMELLKALCVRHADAPGARRKGPKALLEDALEAVHRVLYFEYARPLRAILRRLMPPGCTRCTPAAFEQALRALNSAVGAPLLSEDQIHCLTETLDADIRAGETQGHFDFEDYFESFEVVDTLADEDESGSDLD